GRKISYRVVALTARSTRTLAGLDWRRSTEPTLLPSVAKAKLILGTVMLNATGMPLIIPKGWAIIRSPSGTRTSQPSESVNRNRNFSIAKAGWTGLNQKKPDDS